MKILIINGDGIDKNSSANLCHLAYIKGLLDAGHTLSLLCASSEGFDIDPEMKIPDEVTCYRIKGVSLYEKLSLKKAAGVASSSETKKIETTEPIKKKSGSLYGIIGFAKKQVLGLYGVHGIYLTFVRKASNFKLDEEFDMVISLSTPTTSHLLAHKLIKKGNIKTKDWIQIWEDPWYSDGYGFNGRKKVYREEKRLLSFAWKICYVSPLTLKNQQKHYPESAHKMYWQPLPHYYGDDNNENCDFEKNVYGYFGDYSSVVRNLVPFYEAAKATQINTNICGQSDLSFSSTEKIFVYPRLKLKVLKPIENKTNVLVFLCNRKGGQIPGKIYQYSATNKTILFILDGTEDEKKEIKAYFEKFNRYVFCENTVEDIAKAIDNIENNRISVNNDPVDEFSPKIIAEKILQMK